MDPDQNLREQITLAGKLCDSGHKECANLAEYEDDVNRLCELVMSLDEWIRKGGVLPLSWQKKK